MGDLFPITYNDIRDVPTVKKDHTWDIVDSKFEFYPVETASMKGWVLSDIGQKWKDWKSTLRGNYYEEISDGS